MGEEKKNNPISLVFLGALGGSYLLRVCSGCGDYSRQKVTARNDRARLALQGYIGVAHLSGFRVY
jgi:hypothetical protein